MVQRPFEQCGIRDWQKIFPSQQIVPKNKNTIQKKIFYFGINFHLSPLYLTLHFFIFLNTRHERLVQRRYS